MDNNYIVILDFMVRDLKLKGSELLVYALIYGFSQDGESKYYGSRRYIADWFNCSLPTIDKALNRLLEKGIIFKHEEVINGVKFNRFSASKETLQGIKNLYRGSKETLHNNNIYNTRKENNISKDIFKRKFFEKETLNDLFIEFLEQRKRLKAINSERAITQLLNRLEPYDDLVKEQMIEESLVNSWKSVFPIKKKKDTKKEEWWNKYEN